MAEEKVIIDPVSKRLIRIRSSRPLTQAEIDREVGLTQDRIAQGIESSTTGDIQTFIGGAGASTVAAPRSPMPKLSDMGLGLTDKPSAASAPSVSQYSLPATPAPTTPTRPASDPSSPTISSAPKQRNPLADLGSGIYEQAQNTLKVLQADEVKPATGLKDFVTRVVPESGYNAIRGMVTSPLAVPAQIAVGIGDGIAQRGEARRLRAAGDIAGADKLEREINRSEGLALLGLLPHGQALGHAVYGGKADGSVLNAAKRFGGAIVDQAKSDPVGLAMDVVPNVVGGAVLAKPTLSRMGSRVGTAVRGALPRPGVSLPRPAFPTLAELTNMGNWQYTPGMGMTGGGGAAFRRKLASEGKLEPKAKGEGFPAAPHAYSGHPNVILTTPQKPHPTLEGRFAESEPRKHFAYTPVISPKEVLDNSLAAAKKNATGWSRQMLNDLGRDFLRPEARLKWITDRPEIARQIASNPLDSMNIPFVRSAADMGGGGLFHDLSGWDRAAVTDPASLVPGQNLRQQEGGILFSHGPAVRGNDPTAGIPVAASAKTILAGDMGRIDNVATRFGTQSPDPTVRSIISVGTDGMTGSNYNTTLHAIDALKKLQGENRQNWKEINDHLVQSLLKSQDIMNKVAKYKYQKEINQGLRPSVPYAEKTFLGGDLPRPGQDITEWLQEKLWEYETSPGDVSSKTQTIFGDRSLYWSNAFDKAGQELGLPSYNSLTLSVTDPLLAGLPASGWASAMNTVFPGQEPKPFAGSPFAGHQTYLSYLLGPERSSVLSRNWLGSELSQAGKPGGIYKDSTSHGATRAAFELTPEYIDGLLRDQNPPTVFGGFNDASRSVQAGNREAAPLAAARPDPRSDLGNSNASQFGGDVIPAGRDTGGGRGYIRDVPPGGRGRGADPGSDQLANPSGRASDQPTSGGASPNNFGQGFDISSGLGALGYLDPKLIGTTKEFLSRLQEDFNISHAGSSPLSINDGTGASMRPGTYERIGGAAGKQASDIFRDLQEQVDGGSRPDIALEKAKRRIEMISTSLADKPGLIEEFQRHLAAIENDYYQAALKKKQKATKAGDEDGIARADLQLEAMKPTLGTTEKQIGSLITRLSGDKIGANEAGFWLRSQVDRATALGNILRLKYNIKSSAINLLQPLETLWPRVSTADYARITAESLKPSTRKRLEELGVVDGATKLEESARVPLDRALANEISLDDDFMKLVSELEADWAVKEFNGLTIPEKDGAKRIPKTMAERLQSASPFTAASSQNRIMGYLYGELDAKKKGITDPDQIHRNGLAWAEIVEFDNSTYNAPPVMRSTQAKLLLQYKGFTLKSLENLADLATAPGTKAERAARLAKWGAAKGTTGGVKVLALYPAGAVGLAAYAYARDTFKARGMSEEEAQKAAEGVYFGLPALAGADISGSLGILEEPFGETPNDKLVSGLMGPTISSVSNLMTMKEQDRNPIDIAARFSPYVKQGVAISDMITGKNKDVMVAKNSANKKGSRPPTLSEMALRGLAVPLAAQSGAYADKDLLKDYQKEIARLDFELMMMTPRHAAKSRYDQDRMRLESARSAERDFTDVARARTMVERLKAKLATKRSSYSPASPGG